MEIQSTSQHKTLIFIYIVYFFCPGCNSEILSCSPVAQYYAYLKRQSTNIITLTISTVQLTHYRPYYTRKNLTTCNKSTNRPARTGCQQVWNRLLTTCILVHIFWFPKKLFQQGCYNHDITVLLQPCVVNLVIFLLYHDCIRLFRTTLQCLTTCSRFVTKNTCKQTCYSLFADL